MRLHGWSAISLALLGAASLGSATAATPVAGLDAIYAYAGTWKARIDRVNTPYSKAGHENNTLHNDCWRSGSYLACRQIVNGDPKVLLVFTCRTDGRTCSTYQVPSNGGAPGSGVLILNGKTWVFPWSLKKNGKTIHFRVLNGWSSPRTIEFRQEFSNDDIHWIKIASGGETKIPAGEPIPPPARRVSPQPGHKTRPGGGSASRPGREVRAPSQVSGLASVQSTLRHQ